MDASGCITARAEDGQEQPPQEPLSWVETTWDSARALSDSASVSFIAQAYLQRRPFHEFALGSSGLVDIIPKRWASLFPVGLLTPKWAGHFRVLKRVATSTYHLA